MRILFALTVVVAIACGSAPKKEGSIVSEGSDTAPTCCCKTLPAVGEKEIVPVYTPVGRMECSSQHGDCVDDVQCNGQTPPSEGQPSNDGVPPPPALEPSTNAGGL